jgi:isocitrate/methylisocitrate lyase
MAMTPSQLIQLPARDLAADWASNARWAGIQRTYTAADVVRLRGSVQVEHTLARLGAERLWRLLHERDFVAALGALTGGQAVQAVKAGLEAIYLSGWQVAADANLAEQVYPDQSLYPANSVPAVARRINNALRRADQIEDQLASEKKCGHLGGKVLVPTGQFVRTLTAARLAADVGDVPTLLVARTDALDATLLTSDVDERDQEFLTGERTAEGYFRVRNGLEAVVARCRAYAPYADLLWFETSKPDLGEAARFAEAVHAEFPGKLLAYNCSPSFNWKRHLDDDQIAKFQGELAAMGYRFQFITLAGFHALNTSMFELARGYAEEGMSAYAGLQQRELELEADGYTATRHQREVGTGYFDMVAETIGGSDGSTVALAGSTEADQF